MKFRIAICTIICLGLVSTSFSQTWDEWFKQKQTQRKYLLQQITKLQAHLKAVREGYNTVKKGLDIIGQIKDGDLSLHELFFSDQWKVKRILLNHSQAKDILTLYQRIKSESRLFLKALPGYKAISPDEIRVIKTSVEGFQQELDKDLLAYSEVISNDQLQMSDEERLKRIRATFESIREKKIWLTKSITSAKLLQAQRSQQLNDYNHLRDLIK